MEIRKVTFGMLSVSLNNAVEMLKGPQHRQCFCFFFASGGATKRLVEEQSGNDELEERNESR